MSKIDNTDPMAWLEMLKGLDAAPPATDLDIAVAKGFEAGVAFGRAEERKTQGKARNQGRAKARIETHAFLDEHFHWAPSGALKRLDLAEGKTLEALYKELADRFEISEETARNYVDAWRGKSPRGKRSA